jgi:hypothetical protein
VPPRERDRLVARREISSGLPWAVRIVETSWTSYNPPAMHGRRRRDSLLTSSIVIVRVKGLLPLNRLFLTGLARRVAVIAATGSALGGHHAARPDGCRRHLAAMKLWSRPALRELPTLWGCTATAQTRIRR